MHSAKVPQALMPGRTPVAFARHDRRKMPLTDEQLAMMTPCEVRAQELCMNLRWMSGFAKHAGCRPFASRLDISSDVAQAPMSKLQWVTGASTLCELPDAVRWEIY